MSQRPDSDWHERVPQDATADPGVRGEDERWTIYVCKCGEEQDGMEGNEFDLRDEHDNPVCPECESRYAPVEVERVSEHPGADAAGHDPARANPKDLTATQHLHLAAQRMSEEEREAIATKLVESIPPYASDYEVARLFLSTLLPGPEEEGDDDD